MQIKLITPPTEEPVTLAEMKAYLRLDGNEVDPLISSLITAAREHCENFQNRAYVAQVWELAFDSIPEFPLKLRKPPLLQVESISFTDTAAAVTVWDPTNYIPDNYSEPGRLFISPAGKLADVKLAPANGVKIRYTAGYGAAADVPEVIKTAMKIFVAHRFENPDEEDVPEVVKTLLRPDRVMPV